MLVNTSAKLIAALKAGVTSVIVTNAPLDDIHIENIHPTTPIVITSLANGGGNFQGCFSIVNSDNIELQNISIDLSKCGDIYWPGRIRNSSDIILDKIHLSGNGPSSSAGGILIQDSQRVTVKNSLFHSLGSVALNAGRVSQLTIENNEFSNWGKSAVGVGQVQGLIFRGNYVHDAHPIPGTHPDAIQLFTAGTSERSSDIVIDDNRLVAGDGVAFQGIFIQDEVGDKPYKNVEVRKNVILGCMWNAIYLKRGSGEINITDNKAYSWRLSNPTATRPGMEPVQTDFTAGILVWTTDGSTLVERGNQAQRFSDAKGNPSRPPEGNSMAYDAK